MENENIILAYLNDQLPEDKAKALLNEAKRNYELAELLEQMKLEHEIGILLNKEEIGDFLQNLKVENKAMPKQKTISLFSRYGFAAAAALVLIPFLGLLIYANINLSDEAIVSSQKEVALLHNLMSDQNDQDRDFQNAYNTYYVEKDFEKARIQFANLKTQSQYFELSKYYQGFCLFEMSEYETALKAFQSTKAQSLSIIEETDHLDWMILRCKVALKAKNSNSDLDAFIVNSAGTYQKKAIELREKLNHPLRALSF